MARRLTPAQENYLEFIYRLSQNGPVRVSDLSAELGVQRPSVSRAVRELAKVGLVRHEPYGRIELTTEGNAAGEAVARRDSCLTRLLVEVLDMSPEAADPEVHRLEHFVSDEVTWRLETLVRFALSSEGWVKRLHHRLRAGHPGSEVAGPHRVGETRIHKGPDVEKTRLDLP